MQTILTILAFSFFGLCFLTAAVVSIGYVLWFIWMLLDPRMRNRIVTRLEDDY